jgi:L-alanine-DL-glutamate epimerase-like enolase superfamily enzyme
MSPIAALAAVHCAAASENFMVLENHSVDEIDTWSQMVEGLPVPLIQDGYIQVPEGPGLGFTDVNEEVLRAHLNPKDPGYFESTDDWNDEHAHDRLWS